MYRAYFDWNVISSLKKKDNLDSMLSLKEFLRNNTSNILIPYSSAHIQDLLKGSEKSENSQYIIDDLDFLDEISNKNCLFFDFEKKYTIPKIGSSHFLFKSFYDTYQKPIFHPDYIESSFEDTMLPSMGKVLTQTWKRTPVDIDFEKFAQQPDSRTIYEKYFLRTRLEKNLYNFMLDYSDFYADLNKNPELYKSLTRAFRNIANIDPKRISNLKDPVNQLNTVFLNSRLGFDFDSLSTIENSSQNTYINNFFVKFVLEYAGLDMSGYHPDSITSKNLYSNFANDSHHAFFAGHCDYFVSFEKKLLKKAKALYDKYGVETKTLFLTEFFEDISQKINHSYEYDSFLNCIIKEIEKGYIDTIKDSNSKETIIHLFRPETPLLTYFNFLYVKKDSKDRSTIFLRHIYKNFSNLTFFDEVESIVNKCSQIFGIDISNKSSFIETESDLILKKDWTGRVWLTKEFLIQISSDELSGGIQLTFEQITEDYLDELKH